MRPPSERDRQTLEHWRWRLVSLVLGGVLALAMVAGMSELRGVGEELSLGPQQFTIAATWRGDTIAAKSLPDFPDAYPPGASAGPEALWLGNSQLHTINQYTDGEQTAMHHASEDLGWPAMGLSLANGSLQEHLVVAEWALERRSPDWLILALVYDDLRENGLRPEMELLTTDASLEALAGTEIGADLARELADRIAGVRDDGLASADDSLQDRSEAALEELFSGAFPLWAYRADILSTSTYELVKLRNVVFQIDPTTKRRMIPVHYDRNMAALDAILGLTRERGVRTLVYIAPLRQDIEPPYDMSAYRSWKETIRGIAEEAGAIYADLDSIVPGEEWGTIGETKIDFMHFRVGGHEVLGREVARALIGAGAPAQGGGTP